MPKLKILHELQVKEFQKLHTDNNLFGKDALFCEKRKPLKLRKKENQKILP
jgi:hypothetical protein